MNVAIRTRKRFARMGQFLLILVLASLTRNASGQATTAQVTGQITHAPTGAIPGAEITLTNLRTGFASKVVSNDSGYYTAPLLPPSEYRISVQKQGFHTITQESISLVVDQVARLDFQLEIGSVAENIEVLAEVPTVESSTSALGTVVSNEQIKELPLNSRNPLRFVYLVPGFAPRATFIDQFNRAGYFSINGGRSGMNDLFIDGISNSVPGSNQSLSYAVFPSPDALQEFKVLTNSFSAEYGRSGGGVISMIMRSGTNQYRGAIYEFLRNSAMDANDFFSNRAGRALPSFRRSQFGAAVGGPVLKDKLFFFGNYEGLRQGQATTFTGTFPTALELAGDLSRSSQLVGKLCQSTQIFDPTTTRPNASGSGYLRAPFAGNVIPADRIDPVAAKVAKFFPAPNLQAAACTGANNYFFTGTNGFDVNQFDSKVDWIRSERNRFFGGLSYRRSLLNNANYYDNIACTDFQAAGFGIPSWGARLDYTRVQSSNLLLNIRAGYSTVTQDSPPLIPKGFSLSSLGFSGALESQLLRPVGFPVFNLSGYSSLGQTYTSPLETFKMFSLAGNATLITGRHALKFGVDARLNQVGSSLKTYTSGQFNFDRALTQGSNPNLAQANLGSSVASFLLGAGASGFVNNIPSVFTSNFYTALFIQDDIKLTPHLTLNLGLRNDFESGKKDRFGQLAWFDYNAPSPLAAKTGLPDLRGGVRAQGSTAATQYPNSWLNLGPRVGLAWSATPKAVIRAGYGILYLPYIGMAAGNLTGTEGFSTQTSWVSSIDGLTPANHLKNAFPNGLLLPTGSNLGLLTNVGQNQTTAIDRQSIASSYVQQWNLALQRELPGRIVIEPAYVGSKGTHLTDLGWEMNQLTPEQLALGTGLQQLVANPFYQIITNGLLSGPKITRGQLLRPYPQFLSVTNFRPTSAGSTYHAFQLRAQRQFSKGASFLLAFTGGKLINDAEGTSGGAQGLDSFHQDSYNRRAERAVSPQDISRMLTASGLYELPVGRNKPIGRELPRWLDLVVGDWQVNGVLTLGSGVPLPITTTTNTSGSYSSTLRPNVSGDPNLSSGRSTTDQLQQWFNTSAFSQPAPFTFGNAPRTLPSTRAPGIKRLDLSLLKQFSLGEKRGLELRAEIFNLTNTPNFGVPGLTFGTGTFGVISTQANTPRQVQLGLKIRF